MSPLGVEFCYFMPAVLLAYWLGNGRAAWQNIVVLAASYLFFASWTPHLLWVIVLSTAVDFLLAPLLAPAEGRGLQRRLALTASIAVNIGLLAFFKYRGFFAESLSQLLGMAPSAGLVQVRSMLAPVGLSFWTLQKLGYVVDVYHGRVAPARSPIAFAAWIAFFPQLLAGPISRARDVLPQFLVPRRLVPQQWLAAAAPLAVGLTLKAYVAAILAATLVDPVFADPLAFSRLAHWAALLGYAGQVFADFAGYSLIAIALARVLGVELPINFNYPFISRSLPEFWRRWHVTLNTWLFDYVFVPLTTSRSVFRDNLPAGFLIVFVLSGLWHGAEWTFVLWGVLHGLGLCVHHAWDSWYKGLCRQDRKWVRVRQGWRYGRLAWLLTQGFFVLTLVPFRAGSLHEAAAFARGLWSSPGAGTVNVTGGQVMLGTLLLLLYHWSALRPGGALAVRFERLPAPIHGLAFGLVVLFLLLFAPVGTGTFIYVQF